MAISPDITSGPYTANGTQTAFPFTFTAMTAAEVAVDVAGVTISSSLYTITLTDVGGTVTFATAPISGQSVFLHSEPDYVQTSEFENEGAYKLTTVNAINRRATVRALVNQLKLGTALPSIVAAQATAFMAVNTAGATQVTAVNLAGTTQIAALTASATSAATSAATIAAATGATVGLITQREYPNTAATYVPQGAVSTNVTAGTGGTNATNVVATFTGGTLTYNPYILYDIVGGIIGNVRTLFKGLYIGTGTPTTPTLSNTGLGTNAVTLTAGKLFQSGEAYFVLSADGLQYQPYINSGGTPALDAARGSIPTTANMAASLSTVNAYLPELAKRFEGYGPGSFVAGQADWVCTARARLTSYFFDTRIGSSSFNGLQPMSPKAEGVTTYNAAPTATASFLFRNGQQHMLRGTAATGANFPQFGNPSTNPVAVQCLGNYGSGATSPPLIDTRYLVTETWTNVTGDIWETTLPVETTVFGASGAAPNVTTARPTLWLKADTDSDSIGTRLPWITGGANAAANNTALAALSGVGVTVRAINGSGFETAGEVRSTGGTLSSLVVRVKRLSGINPNSERLLFVNRGVSVSFNGGWHGSFTLTPAMGKDSASFSALATTTFGTPKEIPWAEEVTVYGGGHCGVGCFNTTGKFSGIGVPIEGESNFAQGRTGGYAVHRFSPGIDLRDQWLYNQSLYAANCQVSISMHGAGTVGEGYRGWIVPDDITIVNCTSGISPDLLTQGFYHYGRLDITATESVVNNYNTPYIRIAAKGGQCVTASAQIKMASFANVGGRTIDIGSDNLAEPLWLDASAIIPGSPSFHAAKLFTTSDFGAAGAMNILILRNVRDKLGKAGALAGKAFRLDDGSYYVNSNKVWLDLRAGTTLQNAFSFNTADLSTAPEKLPLQLSWASGVQFGLGNHTFAEIQAAYATLGRTCTIASGAIAVNIAGDVIDVKP